MSATTHVWLTIGVLESSAVNELREILAGLAAQVGIGLTVDLTALDDQHHLSAGALLSVAARTMHDQGSTLTARNPPAGLAAVLAAVPIPVTYGQSPVGDARQNQAIQVGAAREPVTAAPPAHRPAAGFGLAAGDFRPWVRTRPAPIMAVDTGSPASPGEPAR
jgi:hypothetical protein